MHPSPLERSPPMHAPVVTTGRDLRLDLFRGLALWLIFLDHIPSNVVAWGTIRNYGFSDATEIFVFVSGYTAAFVYGKEMRERGFIIAGAHILRRAWQIYVAHVFLFAIYLAEISYVATSFENPLYAEEMNILDFLKQPDVTIVQALLLSRVSQSPVTVSIAAAYLLFAFVISLTWYLPGMSQYVPHWLEELIYPIDKVNLDVLRFAHFLALAVLTVRFVPRDWPLLKLPLFRPAILCGQHSLEIFCLGVFLAFAGHFALVQISDSVIMQVAISALGII